MEVLNTWGEEFPEAFGTAAIGCFGEVTAERADIGLWAGVRHILHLHPIKHSEAASVTAGPEEPQPLNKEVFVKV